MSLSTSGSEYMVSAATKVTPPVAMTGASAAGVLPLPLQDIAIILTILYTIVQLGYTLWKWQRDRSNGS